MNDRTAYLSIIALGSMIAMLGLLSCPQADAADLFGLDVQVGAVKPLMPDLTLDIGLSASVKLFDIPDEFAILAGQPIYVDFLFVTKNGRSNPFAGASVGLYEDLRIGGAVWAEQSTRWTLYLVHPVATF